MLISSIAFLIGIIILHHGAVLPSAAWSIVGLAILLMGYFRPQFRPLAWLAAGFLWAWLQAWTHYHYQLPSEIEGEDLQVMGEVMSVAQADSYRSRFLFKVLEAQHDGIKVWPRPGLVRLNWYRRDVAIVPGQRWHLTLRLKRPNGFKNPVGFDYEGWLFQQGIHAVGYVRNETSNRIVGQEWNLQAVRHFIHQGLQQSLQGMSNRGMILALALGMRHDISQSQWDVLQRTGTSHLIAISGLHIGLVAGLCFMFGRTAWRAFPALCLRVPAPKAAAVLAMVGAVSYAFLAGLAIPTQRALVMVAVVMFSLLLDRTGRPSQTLGLALFAVLLFDPAAVLAHGFWLSFAAVAVLLYGLSARPMHRKGWRNWGRAQWVVSVGLFPLTLFFFQMSSLVSPLANLLAIPWVSLLVVPLVLLGTLFLFIVEPLGGWLLQAADLLLQPFQWLMQTLSSSSLSQWVQASPPLALMLLALLAILLVLSPRGVPIKSLGLVMLLPILLYKPSPLPYASVRFTVLDVGQGLASVVETRGHVLVYDTGPRFSERFDTGSSVVIPYLQQQGVRQIDTMVISHGDNDHRGGLESIRARTRIDKLYTGMPERLSTYDPVPCRRSIRWEWDGVVFQFLHPDKLESFKKNDRSCVLRIDTPGGSILLTGDIHKKSERHLLKQETDLDVDVLVAPHHGSKTSSHQGFVDAVAPDYVVFPSGYRNRFRHPHTSVKQRYLERGVQVLESGGDGAIQFLIGPEGVSKPIRYRHLHARHWSRR